MFNPFLLLSAGAPAPPAWTAAEKLCGNPAAMILEIGIPGIALWRFCMATMESMLLINPPFIKRDWPRLDDEPSETDKRGLGISLRGRLPRRRDPRLTGSVRIRENFNSGRKPFRRRDKNFHIIKLKLLCFTDVARPLDHADFNSEIKLVYFVNLE